MRKLILLLMVFGIGNSGWCRTVFLDGFLRSWKVLPEKAVKTLPEVNPAQCNAADCRTIINIEPVIRLKNSNSGETAVLSAFVSANGGKGIVTVGSNDGLILYLNGKEIVRCEKPTPMPTDSLIVPVDFKKGENTILIRKNGKKKEWTFAVRAQEDSQKKESLFRYTLQAPATWGKTGRYQKVNDHLFLQLTAPKYLKKRPAIRVRHGIMTGLQTEQTAANEKFLDGSILPIPDFVEVRVPPFSCFDSKTGKPSRFLTESLESTARSKVPLVELSPLVFKTPNQFRHPGLYKDITEFFTIKYNGVLPEMMKDSQGRGILDSPGGKNGWNRFYFSYADPLTERYFCRLLSDFMDASISNPAYRIRNLNLKFPSNVDWYFPIANEYFDYSEASKKLFRDFLRGRYGSIEAMNRRILRSFRNFDEVNPPVPRFAGLQDTLWYDWQLYRSWTVDRMQRKLIRLARSKNPSIGLTSWMTTSTSAAVRDGIILDFGMKLKKDYPGIAVPLTCFDFMASGMPLSGELLGQLGIAYGEKIAVEPLFSTPASYRKTLFNVLRFPVDKVTWLYSINASPSWWPWIHEVLNLRPVADELHTAELVQGPVLWMFSYCDVLMHPTRNISDKRFLQKKYRLYTALQDAQLHVPMLTDFSTMIDLARYPAVFLCDSDYLNPEMTAKLADYVKNGGTLILAGKCGIRSPETGKLSYPLWSALGVPASEIGFKDGIFSLKKAKNIFPCGKGKVHFVPGGIAALVDESVKLTASARKLFADYGVAPTAIAEKEGLFASFEKRSGKIRYFGFINRCSGMFAADVECPSLKGKGTVKAKDLVTGTDYLIRDGKFQLAFDTPWQIRVLRIMD